MCLMQRLFASEMGQRHFYRLSICPLIEMSDCFVMY